MFPWATSQGPARGSSPRPPGGRTTPAWICEPGVMPSRRAATTKRAPVTRRPGSRSRAVWPDRPPSRGDSPASMPSKGSCRPREGDRLWRSISIGSGVSVPSTWPTPPGPSGCQGRWPWIRTSRSTALPRRLTSTRWKAWIPSTALMRLWPWPMPPPGKPRKPMRWSRLSRRRSRRISGSTSFSTGRCWRADTSRWRGAATMRRSTT